MNQSDAFGFAYSSLVDKQFYYDTAPFPWPNGTLGATIAKIQTGTMMNAFISYQVNKHLGLRVNVANLLDENFPLAAESTPLYIDPSQPRDFTFEMTYKF